MPSTGISDKQYRAMNRLLLLRYATSSLIPLVLGVVTALSMFVLVARIGSYAIIQKIPIRDDILLAIKSGADVGAVRQVYKNRKMERPDFFEALISQPSALSGKYYSPDTPLSEILQDIRAGVFLQKNPDKSLLAPLDKIIREHAQTNPFDKLDIGQKEVFENIRTKLGNRYEGIQNDLAKVSDELYTKNLAVEKYLRDATFNLWLSVVALFFSLAIALYQIYQNRESRLKEIIRASIGKEVAVAD